MDKIDRYSPAFRARGSFDKAESAQEFRGAANYQAYAANPADAVHWNNHANEIQDSFKGSRFVHVVED